MAGENDLLLRRINTGNDLEIGRTFTDDRLLTVSATTGGAAANIRLGHHFFLAISATAAAPTAAIRGDYDPNLLPDVTAHVESRWQDGDLAWLGRVEGFQHGTALSAAPISPWDEGRVESQAAVERWLFPATGYVATESFWQEGLDPNRAVRSWWMDSPFSAVAAVSLWTDAERLNHAITSRFRVRLPLPILPAIAVWGPADPIRRELIEPFREGTRLWRPFIEVWQQGGYPAYGVRSGPRISEVVYPWDGYLRLDCDPRGGVVNRLYIGGPRCAGVARRIIPIRRTYMSENSASLVRWPDLTPLPVTEMTVETTFDSWCWALTATLAGPDAWALVQPNPLACEVQATINGAVWRFLLDMPGLDRTFNANRVTLKGRSRSAWLHDPYTPSTNRSETEAREMQQLGEAALDNTGWTLDWQGENWLVPAGRYNSWNTPIGVLIRLANVTDDGIYTHPWNQIITLQKRWPVAAWLIDGESATIAVPEAALLSLNQQPLYTAPLNGVYVSGTSHGALALVKIAGTDGALQPTEPIVHELLCDGEGVAARQRGLNARSDSGAGWELTAETLFAPSANPAFPLVPPGQIVSLAGVKGVSRGCRIGVRRTGEAVSVRQTIGLERREVET